MEKGVIVPELLPHQPDLPIGLVILHLELREERQVGIIDVEGVTHSQLVLGTFEELLFLFESALGEDASEG